MYTDCEAGKRRLACHTRALARLAEPGRGRGRGVACRAEPEPDLRAGGKGFAPDGK